MLTSWTTASEKNNDHFEVQKSFDVQEFFVIGKVKGAGNASVTKHYHFSDAQVAAGVTYYRLKQVDTDGSAAYSKLVALERKGMKQQAVLYPNPASSNCFLKIQAEETEEVTLSIYEINGRLISKSKMQVSAGDNAIPVAAKQLTSGFYLVKVAGNKLQATFKLQKISE